MHICNNDYKLANKQSIMLVDAQHSRRNKNQIQQILVFNFQKRKIEPMNFLSQLCKDEEFKLKKS